MIIEKIQSKPEDTSVQTYPGAPEPGYAPVTTGVDSEELALMQSWLPNIRRAPNKEAPQTYVDVIGR